MTVDLQGIFEKYLKEMVKQNPDKLSSAEMLEKNIGQLTERFNNAKIKFLGDLSPKEYVKKLSLERELFDYIEDCLEKGFEIYDLVCDQLTAENGAIEFLKPLLVSEIKDAPMFAARIIQSIASNEAEDVFLEVLENDNYSDAVKEVAFEFLCDERSSAVEKILEKLPQLPQEKQGIFVEVLATYKGNKAIFYWLVTMFYRANDIALYAKLLGEYGDETAIDILKSFAKENEIDFVEYIEIRNAVEMLGGDFDIEKDFSQDELANYVHAISEKGENTTE